MLSRRTRRQFRPSLDMLPSRITPSTATDPIYAAICGAVESAPVEAILSYTDTARMPSNEIDCPAPAASSQAASQAASRANYDAMAARGYSGLGY